MATPPWGSRRLPGSPRRPHGAHNAALAGVAASRTNPQITAALALSPCTADRAVAGHVIGRDGYDHPRRCPTHRALFEQIEDGTQGTALDFLLLLDAFDREDAEVSVFAADLLLDVSAATVPPALHSIDVGELEDSNPIG